MTTPTPPSTGLRGRLDAFVHRYDVDRAAPTLAQARRDLARRTLAPAVVLWALIVGLGLLIMGPLESLPGEAVVNEELQKDRTPALNSLTSIWSNIGATEFIIGGCLVAIALVWWRTREWWLAITPGIAVAVQAAVFMLSSLVVGRGRPEVEHLDVSPPTSGFPSGHTGASVAFYLTLVLLTRRVRPRWLRYVLTTLFVVVPLLVAYSRLYRGMHHPSDVVVGAVNGLVCVVLGWRYLRRQPGSRAEVHRAAEGVGTERDEPDRGGREQDGAERHVGDGAQRPVEPQRLVLGPDGGRDEEPAHQEQRHSLRGVAEPARGHDPAAGVLPQVPQEP